MTQRDKPQSVGCIFLKYGKGGIMKLWASVSPPTVITVTHAHFKYFCATQPQVIVSGIGGDTPQLGKNASVSVNAVNPEIPKCHRKSA